MTHEWLSYFRPGSSSRADGSPRNRIFLGRELPLTYAIGDVHGCLSLLKQLESQIVADAVGVEGEKWIVMLGDYIDRGPASAQVLDHLIGPAPVGFRRFSLAGNHELAMTEFLSAPTKKHPWLDIGGWDTLMSYGLSRTQLVAASKRNFAALVASHIPYEHRQFLQQLPVVLETSNYVFLHGGIIPEKPLAHHSDHELVWFRDGLRESYETLHKTVVHGHQPQIDVSVTKYRICVDTGAYLTAKLSAVRLSTAEPARPIEATACLSGGRAMPLVSSVGKAAPS